jgi:hypothetical protein
MESYAPALITLAGTLLSALVSLVIALVTSRRANDKTVAVMEERIKALTAAVERHNSLVERMYKVEARVDVLEEDIKKAG